MKIAGSEWLPPYMQRRINQREIKNAEKTELPGQNEVKKLSEDSDRRRKVWAAAVRNESPLEASKDARLKNKKGGFHTTG